MKTALIRLRTSLPAVASAFALGGTVLASEGPTASDSVTRLKAGNARFVANPAAPLPIDASQRAAAATSQSPFAGILSCADARVPPELVFHAGLGDLFVVRSAAQVTDKSVLASLEHAVDRLRVPLIVVMGHESCDLVKGTAGPSGSHSTEHAPSPAPAHGAAHASAPGGAHPGQHEAAAPAGHGAGHATESNMEYLARQIRPAITRTASVPPDVRLRAAILENVEEQINELLEGSPLLKRKAEAGELALVGAYYELTSGSVHFSEIVKVAPTTGGAHAPQGPQGPQAHPAPAHH